MRAELDEAREIDVREMSRLLYPDRLELGLVPALRALLGRIPASIATRLTVSDAVRSLDDPSGCSLTVSERLLAVRVVEEARDERAQARAGGVDRGRRSTSPTGVLHVGVENDGELYDPATAGHAVRHRPAGHPAVPRRRPSRLSPGQGEGRPPRGVAAAGGRRAVVESPDPT